MKLHEILEELHIPKMKVRKGTSEFVKPARAHNTSKKKSRAQEKRSWKKTVHEAVDL